MEMITGRTLHVAGVISTDDIIPARYKHMYTAREDLAKFLFANRFPNFRTGVKSGDVLVAKDTFGIGSSREQAVSALLGAGIRAVLAPRFGRIFFRNAWNLALPAIELDTRPLAAVQTVTIDLAAATLETEGTRFGFARLPAQMLHMLEAGGLLPALARSLGARAKGSSLEANDRVTSQ